MTLERESVAWQAWRNATAGPVDWRFITRAARINLTRLYPAVQE